ncbi:Oidioi.mRNA.OKI2018_I69.chr2.g5780.t1.cds [Oikopleura dioica]|uniref:Oidioi.mRNA.OKI2018_I69.chr2.g5780.t1.cds n=1 Tax=Oikopleura dioica TaxID=34765 RepID=A0ABN7T1H7_OIKDI|nr:Oidioi.mRNA.OKI2018_I69.chr2.g5780.t1.cds [Oikopleura dioica]
MVVFVRHLMTIIPQSSLTQTFVHDLYKAVLDNMFNKQLTDHQAKKLRAVVVALAKAETNKVFRDSRSKARLREEYAQVIRGQVEIEKEREKQARMEKECARLERKKARLEKVNAWKERLLKIRAQISRHRKEFMRISRDKDSDASERVLPLTRLAQRRVFDVIHRLKEEFDRTYKLL